MAFIVSFKRCDSLFQDLLKDYARIMIRIILNLLVAFTA